MLMIVVIMMMIMIIYFLNNIFNVMIDQEEEEVILKAIGLSDMITVSVSVSTADCGGEEHEEPPSTMVSFE